MLLALIEWAFVLLYVYCLKRFQKNYRIKLLAASLVWLTMLGAAIAQRQLYQPVRAGRFFSINEYDVVVIAENAVALFILFYGMRDHWHKLDSKKEIESPEKH